MKNKKIWCKYSDLTENEKKFYWINIGAGGLVYGSILGYAFLVHKEAPINNPQMFFIFGILIPAFIGGILNLKKAMSVNRKIRKSIIPIETAVIVGLIIVIGSTKVPDYIEYYTVVITGTVFGIYYYIHYD